MPDEPLKVGDVCEIIGSSCSCEICRGAIGRECVIEEAEAPRPLAAVIGPIRIVTIFPALVVRIAGIEGVFAYRRIHLRKKRPPADDTCWIRQDTLPKADFDQWLARVRERAQTPEEESTGG